MDIKAANAPGKVLRFEVTGRESPCFGGQAFEPTGTYERLEARALCAADPDHPLNSGIINLRNAPRGPSGLVEYAVDVCIIRPLDPARGNGWLFHEVLNRGGKRGIHRINDAPANNTLSAAADAGNGFLMRQGFILAWVAWQGDVLPGADRMLAEFPIPLQPDGSAITGRCRDETIADGPGSVRDDLITDLPDGRFATTLSYPAATLDPAQATLTVRQKERDARTVPPGLAWHYLDERHIEITRPPGFDRGAIYEFVYTARDPLVLGLGFAALRDVVGFLRHAAGADNPIAGQVRRAMLFGLSQSGRMIRDFLHQGFNEGASGQPVFDAMMPVIAGSRRMFMNAAFAQTSRYPRQHEDHAYPGDQFPFTYASLADTVGGGSGGILERARAAGVVPRVMHVDTDSEIWSARASLVVTDTEGRDIEQPDEVRTYLLAGLQHGSYKPPAPAVTQTGPNPLTYGAPLRALILALRRWVEDGVEPPPSRFPSRRAGTLVTLGEARAGFPAIPGVSFPEVINEVRLTDHSQEPPAEGGAYPVFAAATDADGNGIDGIRHPLLMAPLSAYTGWCLRAAGYAEGELYSIAGSALPFALTRPEREVSGDPRASVEERYGSHSGWVARLAAACAELEAAGFLLAEDRERLLAAAAAGWDVERAI